MKHPSQDTLIRFSSGVLEEDAAEAVYAHLAACSACTERFQVIRSIRDDFDTAWGNMVAPGGDLARSEARGTTGLKAAVRGVVDTARRLASAAGEWLAVPDPGSFAVAFRPAHSGVGAPERPERARELEARASEHCASGQHAKALDCLGQASREFAGAGESVELELVINAEVIGSVVISAGGRSISVLVHDAERVGVASFATLRSMQSPDDAPKHAPFEPVQGATYALAEFHEIPDGPFELELSI
jgi:hypothetical protein